MVESEIKEAALTTLNGELFETSIDNVSLHLKNIYSEGELDPNVTTKDFLVVRQEGSRNVKRKLKHYNLDAIISVGYRVNSSRATQLSYLGNQYIETAY